MQVDASSMEKAITKECIRNILWILSIYSVSCEMSNQNTSEESSMINTNTSIMTLGKFSHMTIFLCQCRSGEVMNGTGQCQPYEQVSQVPIISRPGAEPQFIDTKEFNVVVKEPQCNHPQIHVDEGQFALTLRGPVDLSVREGPYSGLLVTDYCVLHQWNQGQLEVTAQACVAVPEIQQCCSSGEHMNNAECVKEINTPLPFNPPLAIGIIAIGKMTLAGPPFPWKYRIKRVANPCKPGHIIKKTIMLDGKEAYLSALNGKTLLTWQAFDIPQYIFPACVDLVEDENTYYAYICEEDLATYCNNHNCMLKCCPEGMALSKENNTCVQNDLPIKIPFPSHTTAMTTFYRPPTCTYGLQHDSHPTDITEFKLTHSGSLIHKYITYPALKFCMDTIIRDSCPELGALVCINEDEQSIFETIRLYVFPACWGLSCAFLSLLLLLYVWIPSLREREGKYQAFHAGSLLIAYGIDMIDIHFVPKGYKFAGACVPLAFMVQFAYLSAFFWLNILCFDVWRLFRKLMKNLYSPVSPVSSWAYMLYGFGGPLIITMVTMIVQFAAPRCGSTPGLIHPRIGEFSCWFKDTKETWPYFYGPISLLFISNLVFIGKTYHYLKIIQRDITCDINMDAKTRKSDCITMFWQQFYILLLIVVLWLTDILSTIIPPKEMWLPTELLNALQGVLIFFVFLSNGKKRGYLKQQLPKFIEFTNSLIDRADATKSEISDQNRKLSMKMSPLKFMSPSTATTSFNLHVDESSIDNSPAGINTISMISKVTSVDTNIRPDTTRSSKDD